MNQKYKIGDVILNNNGYEYLISNNYHSLGGLNSYSANRIMDNNKLETCEPLSDQSIDKKIGVFLANGKVAYYK